MTLNDIDLVVIAQLLAESGRRETYLAERVAIAIAKRREVLDRRMMALEAKCTTLALAEHRAIEASCPNEAISY